MSMLWNAQMFSNALSRYEPYINFFVLLCYIDFIMHLFIHRPPPIFLAFQTDLSQSSPVELCQKHKVHRRSWINHLVQMAYWCFDIFMSLPGSCNTCPCNCHNWKGLRAFLSLMCSRHQRVASTSMATCLWETRVLERCSETRWITAEYFLFMRDVEN